MPNRKVVHVRVSRPSRKSKFKATVTPSTIHATNREYIKWTATHKARDPKITTITILLKKGRFPVFHDVRFQGRNPRTPTIPARSRGKQVTLSYAVAVEYKDSAGYRGIAIVDPDMVIDY